MRLSLILLGLAVALCGATTRADQETSDWSTARKQAREAAGAVGEAVKESAQRGWEATKDYSQSAWKRIKEDSDRAWEKTKDFSRRTWDQTRETYDRYARQPPAPVETHGDPAPGPDLGNATYVGIYDQPITLENGRYVGEPFAPGGASRPTLTLISPLTVSGDLDGDGKQEAAALLVAESGGTGDFLYLAVMALTKSEARNLATAFLGNRVQVRQMSIADGQIQVDMLVAGDEDAAAFPASKARKSFALKGGALRETAAVDLGSLSVADLQGSEWTLSEQRDADGKTMAPRGRISARFEAARISGSAGCNRYFADLKDGGRGEISIGPAGTTRMACPQPLMEQEQSFLAALSKVERFGFRFGDLVLSGPGGTLVFSPRAIGAEPLGAGTELTDPGDAGPREQ
jgi:heat shock protein HslJ